MANEKLNKTPDPAAAVTPASDRAMTPASDQAMYEGYVILPIYLFSLYKL